MEIFLVHSTLVKLFVGVSVNVVILWCVYFSATDFVYRRKGQCVWVWRRGGCRRGGPFSFYLFLHTCDNPCLDFFSYMKGLWEYF